MDGWSASLTSGTRSLIQGGDAVLGAVLLRAARQQPGEVATRPVLRDDLTDQAVSFFLGHAQQSDDPGADHKPFVEVAELVKDRLGQVNHAGWNQPANFFFSAATRHKSVIAQNLRRRNRELHQPRSIILVAHFILLCKMTIVSQAKRKGKPMSQMTLKRPRLPVELTQVVFRDPRTGKSRALTAYDIGYEELMEKTRRMIEDNGDAKASQK
jgi:hypothetical protein